MADGRMKFTWPFLAHAGPADLPMEEAAILLAPDRGTAPRVFLARLETLALPAGANDYLVVRSGANDFLPVAGVLKGLSGGKVTFRYEQEDRGIDLAKVPIIRVAAMGAPPASAGIAVLADGSRVAFGAVRLVNGQVRLDDTCLGGLTVPTEKLASIGFQAGNVTYLSEMEPSEADQAGLFDQAMEYRRDRAVDGKPLSLNGRAFAHGLGLHSKCRLEYKLDGQYCRLVAMAGIDDAARPAGQAVLSIAGDDKELLKPTTLQGAGQDAPLPVNLDVGGVKVLRIVVDFGDGLGVGDHVDLADARLIK